MPRHIDELRNDDPFPVKPGTNEYEALSFLVSHREYGFTPAEIADHTDVSSSSVSKTVARLYEKGLVSRSSGAYYVEPERADEVKRQLESLDSATRLFDSAPEDAYSEKGWEEEVPSIDPDASVRSESREPTELETEAEDLISDVLDESQE